MNCEFGLAVVLLIVGFAADLPEEGTHGLFAIFFFLSFNAPHPMRVLFVCLLSSFAARPLHPPRLADRAALSFPPFVERSYAPGDTIAPSLTLSPSHPLTLSPTNPLTLPLPFSLYKVFIPATISRPLRTSTSRAFPVPFFFLLGSSAGCHPAV